MNMNRLILLTAITPGLLFTPQHAFAREDHASTPVAEVYQSSPPGCTTSQSTSEEKKAAGAKLLQEMMPPSEDASFQAVTTSFTFAHELHQISRDNIFDNLWTRCGLSRHDRELVTLGVLIALRAEGELKYHFPIALRNGLTREELEEVIYQASGYAGMPAAASARKVAQETIGHKQP